MHYVIAQSREWARFPAGTAIFFTTAPRMALWSTQASVQWIQRALWEEDEVQLSLHLAPRPMTHGAPLPPPPFGFMA